MPTGSFRKAAKNLWGEKAIGLSGSISIMRSRKRARFGRFCVSIVVVFVLGFFMIQMYRLDTRNKEYAARAVELTREVEEEQKRTQELAEEEKYVSSVQYIEDTAKSKLGMLHEDEIVFREKK